MSDLSQVKTVEGEYSGFADTVARSAISGKADTSALSGFISGSNNSGYLISSFSDGSSYGGPSFIYKNEAKPNEIVLFISGNRNYTSGLSGKISPYTISGWNTVTNKLDKSAFSAVSGNFLTEVPASAISGKADVSGFELDGNGNISAYNGSAFAGGGGASYSAGDNIDITDDVISGRDWTDDIVSATSGLQPSGDYYSATNPSGFMTELPASATDALDTVTANSGTWGGSALPISTGPGIKVDLVDNTLVFSNDETVLWSGTAHPNGLTAVGQLSEPISAFKEYEIHCSFESMYPYKVNKFSTPSAWENQPNTTLKFGGICEAVSWKPSENDAIMHAFICIGFGSNLTDLYVLSGANIDCAKAAGSSAIRNNSYGAGLYYVTKVVGINRVSGGN